MIALEHSSQTEVRGHGGFCGTNDGQHQTIRVKLPGEDGVALMLGLRISVDDLPMEEAGLDLGVEVEVAEMVTSDDKTVAQGFTFLPWSIDFNDGPHQ